MKYIGWITFFVVIIGLSIGGFVLIKNTDYVPFKYKDVEELSYGNVDITDFVESKITCNAKGCKYRKKDLTYKISDITKIGKQEVTLEIEFESEKYSKTFEVNVVDKNKPVISLNESVIIIKVNEKFNPKKYIQEVTDNYDKLNIDDIKIENNVDVKKEGKYEVIYSISDKSDNVGIAKLIVNVNKNVSSSSGSNTKVTASDIKKGNTTVKKDNDIKKDIEAINNNKDVSLKPSTNTEIKKTDNFSWTISTSGGYIMNNTLTAYNKTHKQEGKLTYSFKENTIRVDCAFGVRGQYNIYVEIKDIETGKLIKSFSGEMNEYGGYFTYEYGIDDFSITLSVQDLNTKNVYVEQIIIKVEEPKELSEILIVNEDKGGYELIDFYILGGSGHIKYTYGIIDSNDPRMLEEDISLADILEETDEGLKLKYQKGYYYEIAFVVENNGKEVSATKKIQK